MKCVRKVNRHPGLHVHTAERAAVLTHCAAVRRFTPSVFIPFKSSEAAMLSQHSYDNIFPVKTEDDDSSYVSNSLCFY